jgi:phage terminase large subunit-like protein
MPRLKITRRQVELLALKSLEDRERFIRGLTPAELLSWDPHFESWRNEGQLASAGDGWRVWLIMAGRGYGKTRAGAQWIHELVRRRRKVRIALVGATIAEARSVMVEGSSGLIEVAASEGVKLKWEPSLGVLRWPSGAIAQLFSGDNADGLRGPEHDYAWCDELAKWRQAEEAWKNLQLGLRRGVRARAVVTTTPRSIDVLKAIMADPWTVTTTGRMTDNLNLDDKFREVMTATYGGTRVGRQELDGELILDVEGALWTREMIAACRDERRAPSTAFGGPPPRSGEDFERVVVGVDPPAGTDGDACGIVVAGKRADGMLYVLEDASVAGLSPEGWANRVAAAAARWGAGLIVAEANNGGAMVKSVLDAAGAEVRVKLVHASKGKAARAEPVALKFERKEVRLAGDFPELAAQLCGLVAGGGYEGPGRSPDRADAMVWALTELLVTRSGLPRIVRL